MVPRVAVVVLCYNGQQDTLACLNTLNNLEYPKQQYEIVVVDNASTDGTVAAITASYPQVTVVEAAADLGYAAGHNEGVRYALDNDFEYVLLLNNNVEVEPTLLRSLIQPFLDDPTIGVAGPMVMCATQPDTILSAGGVVDWRRGTSTLRGRGDIDRGQYAAVSDVDFVSGCAILCSRAALEQVGAFDERFFMYYDETEWCVRATRAGFRVVHVPQARMRYNTPLVETVDKPAIAYYLTRNRLLFLRSTHAGVSAWLHAALLQDLRAWLSMTFCPARREKRARRDAIVCGWRDFWRGDFGAAQ